MRMYIFSGFWSLVFLFSACNRSAPVPKKADPNPNGSSELSLMMRDMMSDLESMKTAIMEGKTPKPMDPAYRKMHTVTPTPGMIDEPVVFEGLSNIFIATWDSLYQPGINHTEAFNALVSSCKNCHQAYCHGPIPRINKLMIPSGH